MMNGFYAHRIKHHRNGIGGRSFWAVYFSVNLTDYNPHKYMANMLAIVPYDDNGFPVQTETYILDLHDADECWRGENFFELVSEAISKHQNG